MNTQLIAAIALFSISAFLSIGFKKRIKDYDWEREVIARMKSGLSASYSFLTADNVPEWIKFRILRGFRVEDIRFESHSLNLAIRSSDISKLAVKKAVAAFEQVKIILDQLAADLQELTKAIRFRSQIVCSITAIINPLLSELGRGIFQHSSSESSFAFMLTLASTVLLAENRMMRSYLTFLLFIAGLFLTSSFIVSMIVK